MIRVTATTRPFRILAACAVIAGASGCGHGPSPLADVRSQAKTLSQLAAAEKAGQVAGIQRVADRLQRDDNALGIDTTGGQLAFAAGDLLIEARHPQALGPLLRHRSAELTAFAAHPNPDFWMRGISDGTQFPTGAGRYAWSNQWRGEVDGCEVTVAAGALRDKPVVGTLGIDSFAACRAGTGRPLKTSDGERIVQAAGEGGALRITADRGSYLTVTPERGQSFRLSLHTGRLTLG